MALAFSVLTSSFDTANQKVYATASVVLTSGRLYYMCISGNKGGGEEQATSVIHDKGGTETSFSYVTSSLVSCPSDDNGVQVWKLDAGSTTGSAAISITYPSTHSSAHWCLVEVTGHDSTGTEVQVVTDAGGPGSSASVTMSAYGASGNAILSIGNLGEFSDGIALTGEHTELAEIDDAERMVSLTQVKNPHGSDTTPSFTWSGSELWCICGVEVKAAAVGGAVKPGMYYRYYQSVVTDVI